MPVHDACVAVSVSSTIASPETCGVAVAAGASGAAGTIGPAGTDGPAGRARRARTGAADDRRLAGGALFETIRHSCVIVE